MNKKLLVGSAVAVLLAGWIGAGLQPNPVAPEPARQLGALAGPDIQSPYLSVGGVRHEYRSRSLTTATTTVCSLQSPSATSTLVHAGLRVGTATTSATTWTLAKNSTGGSATTTLINTISLAGASQGTLVASTTQTAVGALSADPVIVFAPNNYLVWGVAGIPFSAQGTIDFGGVCQAEFIVI